MESTQQLYANAAIGAHPDVLQDIHLNTKNIAILERKLPEGLPAALTRLVERPLTCRASGTVAEITAALHQHFDHSQADDQLLLADVLGLLARFQEVTQSNSFRLFLATVHTNMCRRFHTDINDLRMLCTYVGPGTLWIPHAAIDQQAFQQGKGNEDIVRNPDFIQQVNTGDVVILKGALYPDGEAVLHRSPSIEAHSEKRLLLRLDTNATAHLWS